MEDKSLFRELHKTFRHRRVDDLPENHAASDVLKPTTPLPARTLPGRRRRYLGFAVAILIATITLTALSLILRYLPDMLSNRYGWGLDSISCDLFYGNHSVVEKAFTINLRSPMHFTFAAAKGVDVIWDLFVGQGGRLLLAWISYIVFMDGLTRLLEDSSVSYQLYATMVFDTTSLWSTWSTLNAIFTGHGWRGRVFLAWFFVASIYVLGFPALMSAATGYVNASTVNLLLPDQTSIPYSSRDLVGCYSVTKDSLTGPGNKVLAIGPSVKDLSNQSDDISYLNSTHALFGAIEAVQQSKQYLATYTVNFTVDGTFYTFNISDGFGYCYNNSMLTSDLESVSSCRQESYFEWGFSSLLLYIICSLQIAWTCGMLVVWYDANINSQLCRNGRKTRGPLRAALDIVEAMREVLGEESCAYQNDEIAHALNDMRVRVQYYATDVDGDGVSHIGLSSTRSGRLSLKKDTLYGGLGAAGESG